MALNFRTTRAITFAAGLHPHDGVDEGITVTGDCAGKKAEARFDVTPLAPVCSSVLETGARLVDDEVGGQPVEFQQWSEYLGVVGFVVGVVAGAD